MAKKKKASSCLKQQPDIDLVPFCEEEQPQLDEPAPPLEVPAEPIPCSPPALERPMTSPYTSSPVALHIGAEQRIFYVPRDLLQNPDWFTTSVTWGENIYLASIDENTGHVLVHYLHTGTYQTLHHTKISSADETNVEFKRAILVYKAANTYNIQGLQELAKEKIEHLGAEMDIFDIVEAVKDDFSKLLGDTIWFHDYLNEKVKAMFEKDHTTFVKDDPFDRVDDIGLFKVLTKCMMRLYNDKVERVLSAKGAPDLRISEQSKTLDQPVDETQVADSSVVEEVSEEDCPPVPSECAAPECAATEYTPEESLPVGSIFEECLPGVCDPEPVVSEQCILGEPEPVAEPIESESVISEGLSWGWGFKKRRRQKKYEAQDDAIEAIQEVTEIQKFPASLPEVAAVCEEIQGCDDNTSIEGGKDYPVFASCNLEETCVPSTSTTSDVVLADENESVWSLKPNEEVEEPISISDSDLEVNSSQLTETEGEICPIRARHLFDGDEWKNCRKCRAMVRQVALQLARANHTNQNGYKTVDRVLMK